MALLVNRYSIIQIAVGPAHLLTGHFYVSHQNQAHFLSTKICNNGMEVLIQVCSDIGTFPKRVWSSLRVSCLCSHLRHIWLSFLCCKLEDMLTSSDHMHIIQKALDRLHESFRYQRPLLVQTLEPPKLQLMQALSILLTF